MTKPKPKTPRAKDPFALKADLHGVLSMRWPSVEKILASQGYKYEAGQVELLRRAAIRVFPDMKKLWEVK